MEYREKAYRPSRGGEDECAGPQALDDREPDRPDGGDDCHDGSGGKHLHGLAAAGIFGFLDISAGEHSQHGGNHSRNRTQQSFLKMLNQSVYQMRKAGTEDNFQTSLFS